MARSAILTVCAAMTLGAWLWLLRAPAHAHTFTAALIMWQVMMIAMMTPTTLNWILTYTALAKSARSTALFLVGYFAIWSIYSVAGAALQTGLQTMQFGRRASALTLITAGLIYISPLTRACLRHCRNPMTYFLQHWDNRPRSGFYFGLVHGVYCLGCCWALMLTGFAMGVMNLVWMAVLTLILCLEKLAPRGERLPWIAGPALIVYGATLLF